MAQLCNTEHHPKLLQMKGWYVLIPLLRLRLHSYMAFLNNLWSQTKENATMYFHKINTSMYTQQNKKLQQCGFQRFISIDASEARYITHSEVRRGYRRWPIRHNKGRAPCPSGGRGEVRWFFMMIAGRPGVLGRRGGWRRESMAALLSSRLSKRSADGTFCSDGEIRWRRAWA